MTRTLSPSPYVTRQVRFAKVQYIGHIWQPGIGICAQQRDLSDYDLENIGAFTRENVEYWLALNTGDFREVTDFAAVCGETDIPWGSEESELAYFGCMFPCEEEG